MLRKIDLRAEQAEDRTSQEAQNFSNSSLCCDINTNLCDHLETLFRQYKNLKNIPYNTVQLFYNCRFLKKGNASQLSKDYDQVGEEKPEQI